MAIATATAIMAGASLLGAGASALSSSSAAKKAAAASQNATDQSIGLQREVFNTQQANNAPYLAAGGNALAALGGRLGTAPAPASAGANPLASLGAPPGAAERAYLAAYPDIAAEAQRVTADGEFPSAEAYADFHFQKYGQAEGRVMPAPDAAPVAQSEPAEVASGPGQIDPNSNSLATLLSQVSAARPDAPTRPDAAPRPVMVRPDAGTLNVSEGAYVKSPGYDFQLKEGNRNLLTNKSALGRLESGDASKALVAYGQDYGLKDYAQWRDYTTNQYNQDRNVLNSNFQYDASRSDNNSNFDTNRGDQNFNNDRAYTTDVYNYDQTTGLNLYANKTNDLFRLSSLGQGAVGQAASSGNTFATNTGNTLFSNAATQGNAGFSAANTLGSTINTGLGAFAQYQGQAEKNKYLQLIAANGGAGQLNQLAGLY